MAKSQKTPEKTTKTTSSCISFKDNTLLPLLYGEHDNHLKIIEKELDITLSSRGNTVSISGKADDISTAELVLRDMYKKLKSGMDVGAGELHALIHMIASANDQSSNKKSKINDDANARNSIENLLIKTQKKDITALSNTQKEYIDALLNGELTFASGPAGTGKTFLAVAAAASFLTDNKVDRIILTRPAVEAGEKLGFLPGDMKEKVDPYLQPIYDALRAMLPQERVQKYMENGAIEIAPLAFMRGRTLRNAFVILDEAQNTTPTQMKMFLTRLGSNSRMVVTGDLSQTDLPNNMLSGLKDALARLKHIQEFNFIEFSSSDIVRHPLTQKIVEAYENGES